MQIVHDWIIKNPLILLILFVVLTYFFGKEANTFKGLIKEWDTSQTLLTQVGSRSYGQQALSFPDHQAVKLDRSHWDHWQNAIKSAGQVSRNKRIFYLDIVWALVLVCFAYSLTGIKNPDLSPDRILITFLVIAYLSDLLENLTYLELLSPLIPFLSIVSMIKYSFYTMSLGIVLYRLISNIKSVL